MYKRLPVSYCFPTSVLIRNYLPRSGSDIGWVSGDDISEDGLELDG